MKSVNFYKPFIDKFNSMTTLFTDILKRSKKDFFLENFEISSTTKKAFRSSKFVFFSLRQFYCTSILNVKFVLKKTR